MNFSENFFFVRIPPKSLDCRSLSNMPFSFPFLKPTDRAYPSVGESGATREGFISHSNCRLQDIPALATVVVSNDFQPLAVASAPGRAILGRGKIITSSSVIILIVSEQLSQPMTNLGAISFIFKRPSCAIPVLMRLTEIDSFRLPQLGHPPFLGALTSFGDFFAMQVNLARKV